MDRPSPPMSVVGGSAPTMLVVEPREPVVGRGREGSVVAEGCREARVAALNLRSRVWRLVGNGGTGICCDDWDTLVNTHS